MPKRNAGREYSRQAFGERLVFLSAILAAVTALGFGAYLARRLCDPHWMNRSGAAVVVIQAVVGVAEFSRRRRLGRLRLSAAKEELRPSRTAPESRPAIDGRMRAFLDEEVSKSEFHALAIALCLAAIGEFFHGFGDLVFELFIR